jgi:glutaredoxin-like protein
MSLMDAETAGKVKETLQTMVEPVHIITFVDGNDCQFCGDTVEIIRELCSVSDKLSFEVKGSGGEGFGVDKYPATLIFKGDKEKHERTGIRFFGIPAGYEFTSLLDSIVTVSRGEDLLTAETKDELGKLDKDVHIQVFVTPTCPYCPRAVVLAHHMALVSKRITADMVEASEFQDMAMKYQVMGVPKTVINEKFTQEGAAPERMIMALIRKATSAQ